MKGLIYSVLFAMVTGGILGMLRSRGIIMEYDFLTYILIFLQGATCGAIMLKLDKVV